MAMVGWCLAPDPNNRTTTLAPPAATPAGQPGSPWNAASDRKGYQLRRRLSGSIGVPTSVVKTPTPALRRARRAAVSGVREVRLTASFERREARLVGRSRLTSASSNTCAANRAGSGNRLRAVHPARPEHRSGGAGGKRPRHARLQRMRVPLHAVRQICGLPAQDGIEPEQHDRRERIEQLGSTNPEPGCEVDQAAPIPSPGLTITPRRERGPRRPARTAPPGRRRARFAVSVVHGRRARPAGRRTPRTPATTSSR
jgi:hypothetical protein